MESKVAEEPEIEINARHRTEVERLITGEKNIVDASEIFQSYNKKPPNEFRPRTGKRLLSSPS